MNRTSLVFLVVLVTMALARTSPAVKLEVSEDYFVKLNYLLQPYTQLISDPTVERPDLVSDFYLRRSRILLGGQVSKWVSFFMETDHPNWGKGGDWSGAFFVQDAFVSFNLHEAFKIDVGMLLLPFGHNFRQSAVTLHTLDYHGVMAKYPAGSHKVWRDAGLEVRGMLLDQKLDYRLCVTNGIALSEDEDGNVFNPDDIPRFSGRVAFNFLDPEPDFFFGGTYLGKKKILSVAASFDVQPGAFVDEELYYAFGGDIFWDMPMGDTNRLSGQLGFVMYGGDTNPNQGMGLLFDVGYAFGDWEPVLAFDWFKPEAADDFDGHFLSLQAGLNWWFQGHNANVKAEVALVKSAGSEFGDAARQFTIQTQLFF